VRPLLNLRAKPEHAASAAEGDDGSRHVEIPTLIQAHVPGLGEAKDFRDVASVDEVLRVDEWRHGSERICECGFARRGP
jgi:hypothetical protein